VAVVITLIAGLMFATLLTMMVVPTEARQVLMVRQVAQRVYKL
jgi:hypothetical protein